MFCFNCGMELVEEAIFCPKCGQKVATPPAVVPQTVQDISSTTPTPQQTKEYLQHAMTLEVNRHTMITAKEQLQNIINSLGKHKNFPLPVFKLSSCFEHFWPIFWTVLVIAAIGYMISELPLIRAVNVALLVSFGFCGLCVLFKAMKHASKCEQRQKLIDLDNQRVAKELEQIRALTMQKKELDDKIAITENLMERYYAFNIIKPKYRSLVPVVTMYEYFDYERCYSLTGPQGAYNLFESESMLNKIIYKLDQAVEMLSKIEQNQHALYSAIKESNYYAKKIYEQAREMVETSKATEQNSAIAAYNTKIIAENSTISTYMDFCKF